MTLIAFIGIGAMGEPMAANLLKKGLRVTVVKRSRPEPAARLQALGANVAGSAADAAIGCDIVVLCLPGSREVEATVDGFVMNLEAGAVVVDCSTSNPDSTRRLAARLAGRKVGMVDAGLTRGVQGAMQGTLAFFSAGNRPTSRRRCRRLKPWVILSSASGPSATATPRRSSATC